MHADVCLSCASPASLLTCRAQSRSAGSSRRGGDEGFGAAGGGGGGNSEFGAQANLARTNVQQLLSNLNTIQRLGAGLGTPKDGPDLRDKLHRVIEETKLLSQDTRSVLKELNAIANGGYQGGGTGSQRDKVQARKLNDEFTKALSKFQDLVKTTLAKEREFVSPAAKARSVAASRDMMDEEEDEKVIDHLEKAGYRDAGLRVEG